MGRQEGSEPKGSFREGLKRRGKVGEKRWESCVAKRLGKTVEERGSGEGVERLSSGHSHPIRSGKMPKYSIRLNFSRFSRGISVIWKKNFIIFEP